MTRHVCLMLSALALVACAGSGASVIKTYELIKPVGAPYSRILVVGAHPEAGVRRQLENTLVASLREAQVDALSSSSEIGRDARLDQEAVSGAAESSRADAVLVSGPQDVRRSTTQPQPVSTADAPREEAGSLQAFFRDYVAYEDQVASPAMGQIVITTNLYRVSDGIRVWAIESTPVEMATLGESLQSIAVSTSSQLQRDGLCDHRRRRVHRVLHGVPPSCPLRTSTRRRREVGVMTWFQTNP